MGDVQEVIASEVDDVISITCSDDDDDLIGYLDDIKRDKFRLERKIKQEAIDDYPICENIITTILPKSLSNGTTVPNPDVEQTSHDASPALPKDKDRSLSEKQSETVKATDAVKTVPKTKTTIDRKGFGDRTSVSNQSYSVTKSVERDPVKDGSHRRSFRKTTNHNPSAHRSRALPRLRKRLMRSFTADDSMVSQHNQQVQVWERMHLLQQQSHQLINLVENLYVKLNEKSTQEEVRAAQIRHQTLLTQEALRNAASEQRYNIESHGGDSNENHLRGRRQPYGYEPTFENRQGLAWTGIRDHPQRKLIIDPDESLRQRLNVVNDERKVIRNQRHVAKQLRRRTCMDGFIQERERGDQNWHKQSDKDMPYHIIQGKPFMEGKGFQRSPLVRNRIPMSGHVMRHERPVQQHRHLHMDYPWVSHLGPQRDWEGYEQNNMVGDKYVPCQIPCSTEMSDHEANSSCRNFVRRDVLGECLDQERQVMVHEEENLGTRNPMGEHPHHSRHMLGINREIRHQNHVMQGEVMDHWDKKILEVPPKTPHELIQRRGQLAQRIGRRIISRQPPEFHPFEEGRNVLRRPQHIPHGQGYWPRNHLIPPPVIPPNELGAGCDDFEAHRELLIRGGPVRNF